MPSITDVVLILLLIGFIGAGWKDGFIRAFGRLAGVVLGWIGATWWSGLVGTWLAVGLPVAWSRPLAFLLIFLLASRLVAYVVRILEGMFHVLSVIPLLQSINAVLGGFLGFFEGLLMIGAGMYLIMVFRIEPHLVMWLSASHVAEWIRGIFRIVIGLSFAA